MSREDRTMDEKPKKPRKPRQRASGATATATQEPVRPLIPDLNELYALLAGEHANPHGVLGAHPLRAGSDVGIVVRALHPTASSVECLLPDGSAVPMERIEGGIFHVALPDTEFPARHRFRFHFADGSTWERGDPYRFEPTVGEVDLH